jgi:rhamnogalacturonan endolyase
MEDLNRGVVAVPSGNGVYVGWRLFGYDPDGIAFNVYRGATKLNASPITNSTNYFDASGTTSATYSVRPVLDGTELAASETASVWNDGNSGGVAYLSIPTEAPPGGTTPANEAYTYTSSDASVGDLDGDGQYELVVKWDPSNAKDNSQDGYTGPVYLDAYRLSGERLWRMNLGINIRAGAHYTQFIVYDLDGDGKAEVMLKTAPGTKDATGAYLHTGPAANDNDASDYRNTAGRILTGPEYLTLFNGLTGAELVTTNYLVGRGNVGSWGNNETYGNRVDRFLATVLFSDNTGRPSVIMGRGMYGRTTFSAWNWRDGQLTNAWVQDYATGNQFAGKGAHSISAANIDDDPMMEIINGSATFDNDGKGICSVPPGHGDALHVTDLIPSRTGLEVFMPYESSGVPAYGMRDARTCQMIWQGANSSGEGPGRGVAADVDPNSPGAEAWVNSSQLMRGASGQSYDDKPSMDNFLIWWDADLSRELLNSNQVRQYDGQGGILTANGCTSNNGTKSVPTLSGDIIGDWREEVLFRCGNEIRVYTTNEVASNRIFTLMHDPQYRVAISWQNVEYNQPPHPSFHIGQGMAAVPKPNIHVR